MRLKKYISFIVSLLIVIQVSAQVLFISLPLKAPTLMTIDEYANIYVAFKDRSVVKFSDKGDSLNNYRFIKNGSISYIDVTNPMQIIIVQPNFNKITLLDRQLSPISEMEMNNFGVQSLSAIGQSRDGMYWIYDNINGKLKKFNQQFQLIIESNDLRSTEMVNIQPVQIVEDKDLVVILGRDNSIHVMDRFANYMYDLEFDDIRNFQLYNRKLIFYTNKQLNIYDFDTKSLESLPLPKVENDIMDVKINREKLYILTPNYLNIYQLHN